MKPISLAEIRDVLNARPLAPLPSPTPMATSIGSDTRTLKPRGVYFAIRGRTDGHAYLPQAAAAGAIAAVIDSDPPAELPNLHMLRVPDARRAMGRIAAHIRRQLTGKVVAVAGSNGKTSTKFMIHSALRRRLRGSCAPKSHNNDIGVPWAIFDADPTDDYLVLEIGTNHPGEVANLTQIATPDVAVITNCSAEHLEFLGDLMGVRKENASICQGLRPNGLLVVNGDDPQLLEAVAQYKPQTVTFGFNTTNQFHAEDIRCDPRGTRFRVNGRWDVIVPALGRHSALNALAAMVVARRLNLTEEEAIEGLRFADRPDRRLELSEAGGVTILNDAYNANPASMMAALDTLASLPTSGRRIAVLGDMLELGPASERLHREIGEYAARSGLDALVCVGRQGQVIAESCRRTRGHPRSIRHYPDRDAARRGLSRIVRPGDLVLFKASRGLGLDRLAVAVAERAGATPQLRLAAG